MQIPENSRPGLEGGARPGLKGGEEVKVKKGFTLLELVVVIIIIAVLASLGFSQYTKILEKGRASEARTILGQLRTAEIAYYLENGVYGALDTTTNDLYVNASTAGLGSGDCGTANFFFYYSCNPANGRCTANRCGIGGKPPVGPTGSYAIYLDVNGTWGGTAGYY